VLLGRDTVLGRTVALKVLREPIRVPDERAATFERIRQEARAVASLSHPGIVTLFDMGEDDEVGLYLVFEHIHGETLRERLGHGPLPLAEVAHLARVLG